MRAGRVEGYDRDIQEPEIISKLVPDLDLPGRRNMMNVIFGVSPAFTRSIPCRVEGRSDGGRIAHIGVFHETSSSGFDGRETPPGFTVAVFF